MNFFNIFQSHPQAYMVNMSTLETANLETSIASTRNPERIQECADAQ